MTTAVRPAPISQEDIAAGVGRLLDVYAGASAADRGLICYTPDSRTYAAHIAVGMRLRGIEHDLVGMRPLEDAGLPARLMAALPDPDSFAGSFVVVTVERDTMSHFDVFTPLFGAYGQARCKILRIISASDEFFGRSMDHSPAELSDRNATLLHRLRMERQVQVTAPGGTRLSIELDHEKFQWISNRGKWRPGGFTVLPAGEIATYPARVDGTLVADGALNCNVVTRMDMRTAGCPVRVEIRDSEAVAVECANPELLELIEGCFARPHGRKVGELGFGTNDAIGGFVPDNSHLNERHPSLHIGQHDQALSVVPDNADVHLDMITDDATILLPTQGRSLTMSQLEVEPGIAHPVLLRDEDITGDCCSTGCVRVAL